MSYCINCGQTLFDGAKFCHACGFLVKIKDSKQQSEILQYLPFIYEKIEEVVGYPYVRVWMNGKVGLIDFNGNIVIPCKYDHFNAFFFTKSKEFSYAEIMNNTLWGFFHDGKEITSCKYLSVERKNFGSISAYIIMDLYNQVGLLNCRKWIYTDCVYDKIEYRDNLFIAEQDTLFSILNIETCKANICNYDKIEVKHNYVYVYRSSCCGIFNMNEEKLIPCIYNSIKDVDDGFIVEKDGAVGKYSYSGHEVIPCKYSSVQKIIFESSEIKEQFFQVTDKNGFKGLYPINHNLSKGCIIDCYYEEILPLFFTKSIYTDHWLSYREEKIMLFIVKKSGKYFFTSYNRVLRDNLERVHLIKVFDAGNGKVKGQTIDNKYGIIDFILVGEVLSPLIVEPFKYDMIEIHNHEKISYQIGNICGIKKIGIHNEPIISFYCEKLLEIGCNEYKAKVNGKYGVIDNNKETIIPFQCDELYLCNVHPYVFGTNMLKCYIALKNGKWGVLYAGGVSLIPFIYDAVEHLCFNIFKVRINDKYGCVEIIQNGNNHGYRNIINADFEDIIAHKNGYGTTFQETLLFVVKLANRYGLYHKDISLLPCEYKMIEIPCTHTVFCKKNERWECYYLRANKLSYSFDCDSFEHVSGEVIICSKSSKYGLCFGGTLTVAFLYEEISPLNKKDTGLFKVRSNGKYGILSNWGRVVIDFKYGNIEEVFIRGITSLKIDERIISLSDLIDKWKNSGRQTLQL